ncbi:MAG TPA: BamA/TamA family outer membrane protein [Vicinamibacterales bacterium]|nr:BamA/TamA family outer membrane protein [Vicinamibacterales bacterium]
MIRHRCRLFIASVAILACGLPADAQEREPETRAEALRREREEKATRLTPPDPNRLERALLDLENGRLFERLLSPAEGLYPKIGTITAGSGLAVGPGYRASHRLGGAVDFSAFAMGSIKKYWIADARVQLPRLLNERLGLDAHVQTYDFQEELFFGIGPDSARADLVHYGLRNTIVGGSAAVRPTSWLTISGGADFLNPRIESATDDEDYISTRFDDVTAPGLADQPDFMRYQSAVDVNYREPRGNPRAGGRYLFTYQRFDDLDDNTYSFQRAEVDLQQYVPLLRDRRILALRGLVSVSEADDGARIPFFYQRTLGGPDDLRGFHRLRFRDNHALLLQAEYRWEIFTAVDGAIFYDTGKVASRVEDLNLRDLESDYGFGFRFGNANSVFLRIEAAFGSRGGTHFVFRFNNVF